MNCQQSLNWWQNLSNNQMDEMREKYHPNIRMYLIIAGYKWIEDMWEKEGSPEPQKLIPIKG